MTLHADLHLSPELGPNSAFTVLLLQCDPLTSIQLVLIHNSKNEKSIMPFREETFFLMGLYNT